MPIPFPGMNPYLEHPDLWPTVHQRFVGALADMLKQHLPPAYQVRLQERRYQVSGEDSLVVGSPGLDWGNHSRSQARSQTMTSHEATANDLAATDLAVDSAADNVCSLHRGVLSVEDAIASSSGASTSSSSGSSFSPSPGNVCNLERRPIPVLVPVPQKIHEIYLEIWDRSEECVTVIEVLSPKKKRPGRGRELYERQREAIFGSNTHFVEIDLLRGWEPSSIYGPDEAGDYRILISRSEQRPRAQLFTWNVMESIPSIVLPLTGPDELLIDLKSAVDVACDRTDLLVNYQQAPLPPLRFEESLWLEHFLQHVGMRPCAS